MERMIASARLKQLLTYTELVKGIDFHPLASTVTANATSQSYQIQTSNWTNYDRQLIGDYLSYLSIESHRLHGVIVSSCVINIEENRRGFAFFMLSKGQGWLRRKGKTAETDFWIAELQKVYAHY